MVQGTTLPPEGAVIPPRGHFLWIEGDSSLYETCNMFYERGLFERLGGFTTRYFDWLQEPFGEDTELGWRARRSGARYRFEPSAVVRHAVFPRTVGPYLSYAWRGRAFPLLAKDVPELSHSFFYRRLFLSRRTALFDAALIGLLMAPRRPWTALAAVPYLQALAKVPAPPGVRTTDRVRRAGIEMAFDAVLCAALSSGSLRRRHLVL